MPLIDLTKEIKSGGSLFTCILIGATVREGKVGHVIVHVSLPRLVEMFSP
jgi:hypothetical protein